MENFDITPMVFFGVLELAFVLFFLALFLVVRSRLLARQVARLQSKVVKTSEIEQPEVIAFEQYLRDEVIRNQEFIEQASASEDELEQQSVQLMQLRKRFLQLEIEAQELVSNPLAFQGALKAGISAMVEELRPQLVEEILPDESEPVIEHGAEGTPVEQEVEVSHAVDTEQAELDSLKRVINNQQDAMQALREELRTHENSVEDMDSILRKLDDFEHQSAELQKCLEILEQENMRLKAATLEGGSAASEASEAGAREPAQLTGLKSMVDNQQNTIVNLQKLLRELAPEASKARQLEEAIGSIQRANDELNGCVQVLEDENEMLRRELEEIVQQLEQQQAAEDAADSGDDLLEEDDDDKMDALHRMEIKVHELEALVEFKDAAIEELEKQYNILEGKYLAATGEKKVG